MVGLWFVLVGIAADGEPTAVVATAEAPPELAVTWQLSVDGAPVGKREVRVRYQPTDGGDPVRVLEAYTALSGGTRKKDRYAYAQRVTANSHSGKPASFHSVISADGEAREVQARLAEGGWNVTVAHDGGIKTYQLPPARVDLSTIDLFDPESDARLARMTQARVLSAETGKIMEGSIASIGVAEVMIGGERVAVDGIEWRTDQGPWRFWFATNGFLVKFEVPILGRVVSGELDGPPPRMIDEFPVGIGPAVDGEDL